MVADAIAGGDIEQSITVSSNDECGKFAKSYLNLIDYVKESGLNSTEESQSMI